MSKSIGIKIQFCFPKTTSVKTKAAFVDAMMRDMKNDKKIGYAGYAEKSYLHSALSERIRRCDIKKYRPLPAPMKTHIEETIVATVRKCNASLALPEKSLFVFVFPWLPPFRSHDKIMGFVTGFTPYAGVITIYLSSEKYSSTHLEETIAHEYAHAVFFHYHPLSDAADGSSPHTMQNALVSEGLADAFAEEILGRASAVPQALTEKQSAHALEKVHSVLKRIFDREGIRLYRDLFFGGNGWKKWTGYAIGYRVVQSFRKKSHGLSWKKLVRMNPDEIFNGSPFVRQSQGKDTSRKI